MECVDSFIRFAITLPILSVVTGLFTLIDLMLPDPLLVTRQPCLQIAIAAAFLLSAGLANLIAPRMRIRTWGREAWSSGDCLSG